MKHVSQKYRNDCGIAVLAMVGNGDPDYEDIRYRYQPFKTSRDYSIRTRRGFTPYELIDALRKSTGRKWTSIWIPKNFLMYDSIISFWIQKKPFVLFVMRKRRRRNGHFIIVDPATYMVHDPARDQPTPFRDYPTRDWRVLSMFIDEEIS